MIVDGRGLAQKWQVELKNKLAGEDKVIALIAVQSDLASEKFMAQKIKVGENLGVEVRQFEYEADITTEELLEVIGKLNSDDRIAGIVVQLPLPAGIDKPALLNSIAPVKDIDALGSETSYDSPVVLAVKKILTEYKLDLNNKKIAIVGYGSLVGKPLANYFISEGLEVEVFTDASSNLENELPNYDVIISGAGVPNLITPDMIKEGAVVIDVGTSEMNGTLVGDVDAGVETKASLFSKTPGGVGPLTVTALFANLVK